MNRDQAKQLLPIMQAFVDGKDIEVYNPNSRGWEYVINPSFTTSFEYRIKPETIKIEHRRYLYNYSGYRILVCDSRAEAGDIITSPWFVRWIDSDWITEEVEI